MTAQTASQDSKGKTNGKGTSKLIVDSEKQDQLRRATKAARKRGSGAAKASAATLTVQPDTREIGCRRDAVQVAYARARQQEAIQRLQSDPHGTSVLLLDELLPKMTSSSPKASDTLAGMLVQFLEAFAFTPGAEIKLNKTDRLNYAMQMVLKGRPFGKVEEYFNKTVRDTYASLEAQVSQQAQAS